MENVYSNKYLLPHAMSFLTILFSFEKFSMGGFEFHGIVKTISLLIILSIICYIYCSFLIRNKEISLKLFLRSGVLYAYVISLIPTLFLDTIIKNYGSIVHFISLSLTQILLAIAEVRLYSKIKKITLTRSNKELENI